MRNRWVVNPPPRRVWGHLWMFWAWLDFKVFGPGLTPGGCGGGPRIVDMRDPVKNVAFLPPHWTSIHVTQGFLDLHGFGQECLISSPSKPLSLWSMYLKGVVSLVSVSANSMTIWSFAQKSCWSDWVSRFSGSNSPIIFQTVQKRVTILNQWTLHLQNSTQGSLGSRQAQNWRPSPGKVSW